MHGILKNAIEDFNQPDHQEAERLRRDEKMFRFALPIELMTYDLYFFIGTVITKSEYSALMEIPLVNCPDNRIFLKDASVYKGAFAFIKQYLFRWNLLEVVGLNRQRCDPF